MIDAAFDAMKAAHKPNGYRSLCTGGGLWPIHQWVAYCAYCKPVPLEVFEGMLGEHQNGERWMPPFDSEAVCRAVHAMPECELKAKLIGTLYKDLPQ